MERSQKNHVAITKKEGIMHHTERTLFDVKDRKENDRTSMLLGKRKTSNKLEIPKQ